MFFVSICAMRACARKLVLEAARRGPLPSVVLLDDLLGGPLDETSANATHILCAWCRRVVVSRVCVCVCVCVVVCCCVWCCCCVCRGRAILCMRVRAVVFGAGVVVVVDA